MNYEKKYTKALEKAEKLYENGTITESLKYVFPELAESEDERMCKRCIDLLRKVSAYSGEEYLGVEIVDCIIWLQALRKNLKESLHISETCKESADSFTDEDERIRKELIEFLDGVWYLGKNANFDKWCKADCAKWIAWLEKQKEQKPNTDMVIEYLVNEKGYPISTSGEIPSYDEIFETVKNIVEYVNKQKPMNEPSVRYKTRKQCFQEGKDEVINNPENYGLQKPVEWSEEDEEYRQELIDFIYGRPLEHTKKAIMDWIKSLPNRPKPSDTWKPSEEQIHAIVEALKYLPNNKDGWRILDTLVDVFRKLM